MLGGYKAYELFINPDDKMFTGSRQIEEEDRERLMFLHTEAKCPECTQRLSYDAFKERKCNHCQGKV